MSPVVRGPGAHCFGASCFGERVRSIATRANAIARIENAKIMNAVQLALCQRALGNEAVYTNDNPLDDRTTGICREASEQPPMTLDEWAASKWGRPPRLRPFHLCRSVLVGGRGAFRGLWPIGCQRSRTPGIPAG